MPEVEFLYRGWESIARVVLVGVVGYFIILVLLRISGQRTLAQMTPFDVIVTVTIGSAFGRVLTAENVPIIEVLVAFVVLVGLQWAALGLRNKIPPLGRLMRPIPDVLYSHGQRHEREMRKHSVTEADLQTAARTSGLGSLADAEYVILEPDGSISLITSSQVGDGSAIEHLEEERRGKL